MRERWSALVSALGQRMTGWAGKPVSGASGFCCLSLQSHDLTLAASLSSREPLVDLLLSFRWETGESLVSLLENVVREHGLQGLPCLQILAPADYHIFLMDSLPVSAAEFQSAIRWKLADLVSFPPEEAIVDHFEIPARKSHDPHPMIMVAVAHANILHSGVEMLQAAGLQPFSIGIRELAFRNLAALYEKDERTTALIYVEEQHTEVLLTRLGLLYLHRRLGPGRRVFAGEERTTGLQQLALELQRSFDYYQLQWRHAMPTRILMAAASPDPAWEDLVKQLESLLAITIQPLDVSEVMSARQALPGLAEQGHYLPVLGGLAGREKYHYATGN